MAADVVDGDTDAAAVAVERANRLILAAGVKLKLKSETTASAAVYFHRLYASSAKSVDEVSVGESVGVAVDVYEPVTMAATCVYLAGKVEEEHLRLRDVINVFYSSVHVASEPLELSDAYFKLRDTLVRCELLLLRVLEFNVVNDHPHRYLLHYFKSLADWLPIAATDKLALARTCWSILNDFYTSSSCIRHQPRFVAAAVIELALRLCAIDVPCEHDAARSWREAMCDDLSNELLDEIQRDILLTYRKYL